MSKHTCTASTAVFPRLRFLSLCVTTSLAASMAAVTRGA